MFETLCKALKIQCEWCNPMFQKPLLKLLLVYSVLCFQILLLTNRDTAIASQLSQLACFTKFICSGAIIKTVLLNQQLFLTVKLRTKSPKEMLCSVDTGRDENLDMLLLLVVKKWCLALFFLEVEIHQNQRKESSHPSTHFRYLQQ